MNRILTFCLFLAASYHLNAANDLYALLPDTNSYPSLQTYKQPELYEQDELFILINGGAEVFYEYGFNRAVKVVYRTPENINIEVYIYEMTDILAAFGIFSYTRTGKNESLLQEAGSLRARSPLYELIQSDRYFISMSWSSTSQAHVDLARSLAGDIAGRIRDPRQIPDPVAHYMAEGYAVDLLKYIRGTLALSPVYFFSHKDIFAVREAVCIREKSGTQIDFHYAVPGEAEAQFDILKNEYAHSEKVTGYVDNIDTFRFTDKRGRELKISRSDQIITVMIPELRTEKETDLSGGF